ncbi:MAG: IS3 family transposase [Gammaproteobacteria bacterium]|nr:IS3 family transposase [Gammaproteobacteria bacterium]
MKYAFIEQHQKTFAVRSLCRVLRVSASGYYDWLTRPVSKHAHEDKRLVTEIKKIHQQSRGNYGAVKTWKALNQQGVACGKHRVARLRLVHHIEAKRRTRFKVTTQSKYQGWIAPNLLQRQFTVDQPNRVWVGDVTFIATRSGWLYLAIVLDLYSRKIVGWSMSDRNNQALVLDALNMAIAQRRPTPGLIHHMDRGQLYAAHHYRETLQRHHMISSMSRKKDCWDNAVAESFFNNLKNELIHYQNYPTREAAKAAIFDYIEIFYNRQRIHQTLQYQSPHHYEMINVA